MTEENFGFCPSCGANLPEGSSFCPECGHNINAPVQSGPGTGVGYGTYGGSGMSSKLKVAAIFVTIYAVMTILGALSLFTIEPLIETYDEMMADSGGDSFEELLESMGYDMTEQEFIDMCRIMAIVDLVSGALAGVGAFLCFKRTKKMIAVVSIAVASVILFVGCFVPGGFSASNIMGTLFNVVIGLLMAYLVYTSPDEFTE